MKNATQNRDAQIQERKRMRPLWEYLRGMAASATDVVSGHGSDLGHFMREKGFEYVDLVALRQRPHHYDTFTASKWEWFLHQAMNHFSNDITKSLSSAVAS